jgi:hypothetical protein
MTDTPIEPQHHRNPKHEERAAIAQAAPTSVEPIAPQDPQAAGAATARQIALLQQNVSGSEQKGAAEKAHDLAQESASADEPRATAGVHAAGSYTGTSHGNPGNK